MKDADTDDGADEKQFGSRIHASTLLQISADDVDEFVGGLGARTCGLFGQHVRADVLLEHLGHESVHGAAGGSDELQHPSAAIFRFERALDGFDLPPNAADASQQLFFVADCMAHAFSIRLT